MVQRERRSIGIMVEPVHFHDGVWLAGEKAWLI